MHASDVTIAIPSYNRGAILVQTITRLLDLPERACEILVVDQTLQHPSDVSVRLDAWNDKGAIRWVRLEQPSIPHAMNEALRAARTPLVLFLDDDIEPTDRLVAEHAQAHRDPSIWAVVGQILQPDENPIRFEQSPPRADQIPDLDFRFNSTIGAHISNAMAGNLSVLRERAIGIGGFDENFIGAAYRFETDFALRIVAGGGTIWFEPGAGLRHLKIAAGGLRSFGDHRRTVSPAHTTGDYYFALKHFQGPLWRFVAQRLRQNVGTRYLLTHPWWIPTKLVGEIRGLHAALRLHRSGRRLMDGPA